MTNAMAIRSNAGVSVELVIARSRDGEDDID